MWSSMDKAYLTWSWATHTFQKLGVSSLKLVPCGTFWSAPVYNLSPELSGTWVCTKALANTSKKIFLKDDSHFAYFGSWDQPSIHLVPLQPWSTHPSGIVTKALLHNMPFFHKRKLIHWISEANTCFNLGFCTWLAIDDINSGYELNKVPVLPTLRHSM